MSHNPDYAVLDRAGFARAAFFPRRERSSPPAGATDHLLEVAPGIQLGARLYSTGPSLPTILYFHGNGEVASDHDDVASMYHAAGVNLFVIEFRGYGTSNGTPTFASLVSDARTAVALAHSVLDEGAFNPTRFVMGRSMGAHSALEIAANAASGLRGMILESGAGNLRRWVERMDLGAEGAQLLVDHEAKICSIRLPCLMIHGELDDLIPLDRAVELYGMLEVTERELVVIPQAGHNDIVWRGARDYFAAVATFVDRHSGASGTSPT